MSRLPLVKPDIQAAPALRVVGRGTASIVVCGTQAGNGIRLMMLAWKAWRDRGTVSVGPLAYENDEECSENDFEVKQD